MELKEKLRQILKEKYGMENDAEIMKEIRTSQGIDLGIFVLFVSSEILALPQEHRNIILYFSSKSLKVLPFTLHL